MVLPKRFETKESVVIASLRHEFAQAMKNQEFRSQVTILIAIALTIASALGLQALNEQAVKHGIEADDVVLIRIFGVLLILLVLCAFRPWSNKPKTAPVTPIAPRELTAEEVAETVFDIVDVTTDYGRFPGVLWRVSACDGYRCKCIRRSGAPAGLVREMHRAADEVRAGIR